MKTQSRKKESNRHKSLVRKVNTTAHGVRHGQTKKDYSQLRNRSVEDPVKTKMTSGVEHGLDYTPLIMFLIKHTGEKWDDVKSKIKNRVPNLSVLDWFVFEEESEIEFDNIRYHYQRVGESSFYSAMYVSESGILKKVNELFNVESLPITCSCCTHTFNGKVSKNKYKE